MDNLKVLRGKVKWMNYTYYDDIDIGRASNYLSTKFL